MLRPRGKPTTAASCLLALSISAPTVALAQTAPPVVSPGRADQNPPGVRTFAAPAPAPVRERNANAAVTPFTLTRVEIEGATLPPAALEASYRPFLGQTMDNPALTRITQAVAGAYGKADVAFYTVLVPPQTFAGGVLKLVVVEGYVQAIRLEGVNDPRLRRLLTRYLEPVVRERPLRTSTFQRAISLVRDVPGLLVDPQLERGTVQGAVRLVLRGKPRRVQVAAGVNDRGTALLGRDQVQVDGYLNGAIRAGDQLHATFISPTDPGLFQFYALSYAAPFNDAGGVVQANVGYLRTRPSTIPLKGSAVSFGLQASQPLIRSFNRSLYLTASLTGVNSDNALFGFTLSNERTRTLRLAASYSTSNALNVLNLSATASLGLDAFGAHADDPGQARTDFRKLNLKLVDTVIVRPDLFLRLNGFAQLTDDLLPASEQVALGGDEFGRAYEAAVISGDYGAAGSAELAWRPDRHVPAALKGSELYTFVDAGRVWYRGRLGNPTIASDVASVGGGLRAQVKAHAVVQVEAVRGLTNPVFYENREVWRLLFSVRTLF